MSFMRRKKILFFIFIFLSLAYLYSQDNATPFNDMSNSPLTWLSKTTPMVNFSVLDFFETASYSDRIDAITYLSKRENREFGFLAEYLYYNEGIDKNEKEYLLFLIFDKIFTDIDTVNATGIHYFTLCNNIAIYRQSLLRKSIIKSVTFKDGNFQESVLIEEAVFLLNEAKKENHFSEEFLMEFITFLEAAIKLNSPILDDYINQIYKQVDNIPYSWVD